MNDDDVVKKLNDAALRKEIMMAQKQKELVRQLQQAQMKEDIDLMEGFYRAAIKQAERTLNSVEVGEIINVNEYGKRLFEIISKNNTMQVKVKDVKTGQVFEIYANQIEKIGKKSEMVKILYEKP